MRQREIGGQTLEMQRRDRARLVLRFGLSCVSYLTIVGAGILLLSSLISAFKVTLVVSIVVLLVVSLRNTWDLWVTVGEVTMGDRQDKGFKGKTSNLSQTSTNQFADNAS